MHVNVFLYFLPLSVWGLSEIGAIRFKPKGIRSTKPEPKRPSLREGPYYLNFELLVSSELEVLSSSKSSSMLRLVSSSESSWLLLLWEDSSSSCRALMICSANDDTQAEPKACGWILLDFLLLYRAFEVLFFCRCDFIRRLHERESDKV